MTLRTFFRVLGSTAAILSFYGFDIFPLLRGNIFNTRPAKEENTMLLWDVCVYRIGSANLPFCVELVLPKGMKKIGQVVGAKNKTGTAPPKPLRDTTGSLSSFPMPAILL